MSIPLDRLYHYLEGLTSDDIIIYRCLPHGSKKIEDLKILSATKNKHNFHTNHLTKEAWLYLMSTPTMICYDQEILDYDRFLPEQLENFYNQLYQAPSYYSYYHGSSYFKTMITGMNLRAATVAPLNIFDRMLLCHSEKNSNELKKYENNGFIGVYYWAHALIARDWFRYAKHDPLLVTDIDLLDRDFLIYNRAWSGTREYRLKFAELLVSADLLHSCSIAFNEFDNDQHYTQHQFKNKMLSINNTNLQTLLPKNTSLPTYSADYNCDDYNTSGMEIVLETLFDDARNHLTEKSLRPIACGKPFMLVSTPGSLKYLRSYGFKTFSGLIDESYDEIIDPLQRLVAIINEMKRISSMSTEEKKSLWDNLYRIADFNKKLFFSEQWENRIVSEYQSNLKNALIELRKTCSGSHWKKLFDPELLDITNMMINNYGRGFDPEELLIKVA